MHLILGSGSPRRRAILQFFSLSIQQIASEFDESQIVFQGDPIAFVQEIAKGKAQCLTQKFPDLPILTADTIVVQSNRLFLKPKTLKEAKAMLIELSGKKHQVYSGICTAKGSAYFTDTAKTNVEFNQLTEAQIDIYHSCFNPLDKSGAYGIQDGGGLIVKRIEGCYYNVMGLPLEPLSRLLFKVGIDLWNHLKPFTPSTSSSRSSYTSPN